MIKLPDPYQPIARTDLESLCRRSIATGKQTVTYHSLGEVFVRVIARFEVTNDPEVYRRVA